MTRTVAIIGAECSGKSTLAHALGRALHAVVVPEYLRTFVQQQGRPPVDAEQAGIMRRQIEAERLAAAGGPAWVVSDGGALMTCVYSRLYFADDSLTAAAAAHHRSAYVATLWCDIDQPWVADAGQRDGPAFRRRGHEIIGRIIRGHHLDAVLISGAVEQRLAAALAVLGGQAQQVR